MSDAVVTKIRWAMIPEAWIVSGLSDRAFRLLSHLDRLAGSSGHQPKGVAYFAKSLGKDLDWVRKALRELEDCGIIELEFADNNQRKVTVIHNVARNSNAALLTNIPPIKQLACNAKKSKTQFLDEGGIDKKSKVQALCNSLGPSKAQVLDDPPGEALDDPLGKPCAIQGDVLTYSDAFDVSSFGNNRESRGTGFPEKDSTFQSRLMKISDAAVRRDLLGAKVNIPDGQLDLALCPDCYLLTNIVTASGGALARSGIDIWKITCGCNF